MFVHKVYVLSLRYNFSLKRHTLFHGDVRMTLASSHDAGTLQLRGLVQDYKTTVLLQREERGKNERAECWLRWRKKLTTCANLVL